MVSIYFLQSGGGTFYIKMFASPIGEAKELENIDYKMFPFPIGKAKEPVNYIKLIKFCLIINLKIRIYTMYKIKQQN